MRTILSFTRMAGFAAVAVSALTALPQTGIAATSDIVKRPPPPNATLACGDYVRKEVLTSANNIGGAITVQLPKPPMQLPGATYSFVVPTGQSYCVTVSFSALVVCIASVFNDPDTCLIDAYIDGSPMNPPVEIPISINDPTNSTHGFEWATRVGAGPHKVQILGRGRLATTGSSDKITYHLYPWTMDISFFR